jgi:iron complex transport system substrate-binding protein
MFRFIACLSLLVVLVVSPALAQSFPVTLKHGLGETTIPAQPQRVVTWGWSAQDVLLDLGVVPVGIPFFPYGGGDDGMLPWTLEAIERAGGTPPTVLPDSTEPPIEAIAGLKPDLILAPYSGVTPEEYELLSRIAPVVPFPGDPWFISWQEVVELSGRAIGKPEEAARLIADTEVMLEAEMAKYPEAAGTVFANTVNRTDGTVAIRVARDPRVKVFTDLGLVVADQVEDGTMFPAGLSYQLSYEYFDKIPAEILINFFNSAQSAEEFYNLPLIQLSPLVAKGAYTRFEGEEITMAVSGAITPMSLRWGFPQVAAGIGEAARKARAE